MKRLFLLFVISFSGQMVSAQCADAESREALFESVMEKTRLREAWSPYKDMNNYEAYRQKAEVLRHEFRQADTDLKLARALFKLSNLRHDTHLIIRPVKGGLDFPREFSHIPIQFAPDFTEAKHSYFIADLATNFSFGSPLSIGDKLLAINGIPMVTYMEMLEPNVRYSTTHNMRWRVARLLSQKHPIMDPALYDEDRIELTFERNDGSTYSVRLTYQNKAYTWSNAGEPSFPGFQKVLTLQNFYVYTELKGEKTLLIDFRSLGRQLDEDLKALVDFAEKQDYLDKNLIFFAAFARGGSGSPKVLRHLSDKPFKTTFGNIRISDFSVRYIQGKSKKVRRWVDKAKDQGKAYTTNEPFKLRYFKEGSKGIMKPASRHFTGKKIGIFSSKGGSNLDQLLSMIEDNDIMHTIGYPTGGYSNTWEAGEVLRCPNSGTLLLRYYWTIGQTIRPNGEVLEGNPAEPNEFIPMTSKNYLTYWDDLILRALDQL